MAKASPQPHLNPVDFYRLEGDEFVASVHDSIEQSLGKGPARVGRFGKLNPYQRECYAWWRFSSEWMNGGLVQYFYNTGEGLVPPLLDLLRRLGHGAAGAVLKEAVAFYRKSKAEFDTNQPFGKGAVFDRLSDFNNLERRATKTFSPVCKPVQEWIRKNIARIATDPAGHPIDPSFTGTVESHHPNGAVAERATVRRGVLDGEYRTFLADGTLHYAAFYKSGKMAADLWPDGRPKHRKMKRGKLTVYEWYYPSGNIHKRFVALKSGYAAEPVRMWYENGQLAEEARCPQGKRFGPWLKFFEDGSPRLEAEYRKGEELVVHNAWDDQRVQVIKNGKGVYFDDHWTIDDNYSLERGSGGSTSSQELRAGIPHGRGTIWYDGVLWATENYQKGRRHGSKTVFYDNGRVRSRTLFRHGKEVSKEEFPKSDHPRPAVIVITEANAELYTAWRQPVLDDYPTPRNLTQIQARLPMPQFLRDVEERNRSGTLTEDYENWNTFQDGATYFGEIDAAGNVSAVNFSGASAYSGQVIQVYPPLIRQLRFKPGRVRGKAVPCRVLLRVEHTFVEGKA